MKYVISFEQNPETSESAFALWDNKYDVGYDWFDFDEMVDGVSMFDNMDDAIDYAREVLPEVFFDKLYIISVNEDEETKCVWTIERED
jgi:hypothetical protein